MKIGTREDMSSSYLSKLNQGTPLASSSSRTGKHQTSSESAGLSDTLEISEAAYDSLAGGRGMMGPPPPMDAMNTLSALVDDGTITSDQANAISAVMTTAVSGTTESGSTDGTNPLQTLLNNLVSAGTLSGDQADAVVTAMTPPENRAGEEKDPITKALDSLVSAGTITSDQEDAITTAIQNALSSGNSSSSDTASSDSSNINRFETLLKDLVGDGTLTEDQAASVAQAMAPPTPPMGMGGPWGMHGHGPEDNSDETDDSTSATNASSTSDTEISGTDDESDLIKNIVNDLLSRGTTSKDSLSSVLQMLNSLDTATLASIYDDLSGNTTAAQ